MHQEIKRRETMWLTNQEKNNAKREITENIKGHYKISRRKNYDHGYAEDIWINRHYYLSLHVITSESG